MFKYVWSLFDCHFLPGFLVDGGADYAIGSTADVFYGGVVGAVQFKFDLV